MKVIYTSRKTLRIILWMVLLLVVVGTAFIVYRCSRDPGADLIQRDGIAPLLTKAGKGLSLYDIDVSFDPEKKMLYCSQRVEYVNGETLPLDQIYFHLYPNAFKDPNKPVFSEEEMDLAYPNGFSPGSIDMQWVKVSGKAVEYQIGGYSEDIMQVPLGTSLKPGKRVTLEMSYTVTLPNSVGRFGYGNYAFNIANWYPAACVYDDEGWNTDPYYAVGDPFYSDVSNYRVEITAPQAYVVAATGNILGYSSQGGQRTWRIEAVAVRDFAWVTSDQFKVASREVDGTTIYSYYISPKAGKKALDYGADSIKVFNRRFGKYPYNQFSVVEADFFIGGMEYPNIVLIDHSLYLGDDPTWLEIVTVHETAHQWWYAMVGNDEVDEAWLDEALTEYSTVLYYGDRYNSAREAEMYREMITEGKYFLLQQYTGGLQVDETIARSVHEFPDWIVYDVLVYGKGAMMFHDMRNTAGDEQFQDILRLYFTANQFKNATAEDLIAASEEVTGKEWDEFFNKWLFDKN